MTRPLFFLPFIFLLAGCQSPGVSDVIRQRAEAGDPRAQLELSWQYRRIHSDEARALQIAWLKKSAEQGYAMAEYHLALAYEFGSGVAKDPVESVAWFRRAADQGHVPSQYHLGSSYERGDGVVRDRVQAFQWFLRAAQNNHGGAQLALARLYEEGEGVPRDLVQAYAWWSAPSAQKNLMARRRVTELEKQFSPERKADALARAATIRASLAAPRIPAPNEPADEDRAP